MKQLLYTEQETEEVSVKKSAALIESDHLAQKGKQIFFFEDKKKKKIKFIWCLSMLGRDIPYVHYVF